MFLHFPVKLKLVFFSAEEQEKLRRQIGEAFPWDPLIVPPVKADKLTKDDFGLDIYLTPFDPSYSQTPCRQANATLGWHLQIQGKRKPTAMFPVSHHCNGWQELVLTATGLPPDLVAGRKQFGIRQNSTKTINFIKVTLQRPPLVQWR